MVWLSEGKELRPSDHGVPNEAEASGTAQSNSPQMLSFFGGGLCSSTEPRPEATNFTAPSWSGRRVGHGDHVKKALIVSSRKKISIAEASGQMRTLAPWKQEVRDEEGRRRFHGAFSGGFSASYYNTVGSKEGWTPQTFTSSRKNRAEIKQQDLTELKLSNTFFIAELFVKEDVVMFEDKCDATSMR